MRSRRPFDAPVADVARRRLELLSAELAVIRPDPETPAPAPPSAGDPPGEAPRGGPPGRHAQPRHGPLAAGGAWLVDRVPPTLASRAGFSAGHVAVVAIVVAGGLALTAWWAVRASDPGELAPVPVSGAPPLLPASPGPAGPVASPWPPAAAASAAAGPAAPAAGVPREAGKVVIDVTGRVRRPGIVTLPAGARVVDALDRAGGARPGVDLRTLNLARPLVDGEQILVGVPAVPGVAASAAASAVSPSAGPGATALVNLNSADQAQLETLPGVGPVTALAILQWRADNGGFTAVEQLLDVSGIGDATLAEIAPFVTL